MKQRRNCRCPPRAARALLGVVLPSAWRREVLEELDNLFRRRWRKQGRGKARRWYWRQALAYVLHAPQAHWVSRPAQAGLAAGRARSSRAGRGEFIYQDNAQNPVAPSNFIDWRENNTAFRT